MLEYSVKINYSLQAYMLQKHEVKRMHVAKQCFVQATRVISDLTDK